MRPDNQACVLITRTRPFRKRDKPSRWRRTRYSRSYGVEVFRETNSPVPEDLLAGWADAEVRRRISERGEWTARELFSLWFETEVQRRRNEEGWSASKVMRVAGLGRATYYNWLDITETRLPQTAKLRLACQRLDLSYGTALAILSWDPDDPDPGPSFVELEQKRQRAEALMSSYERRGVLTGELRNAYEGELHAIERTLNRMLDDFIGRIEADFSDNPARGEGADDPSGE